MKAKQNHTTILLRAARIKQGLSQQQVAALTGVHIRQYQRLEYGERPIENISMHFGLAICAVLHLDPFDLVFQNKESPSNAPRDISPEEH